MASLVETQRPVSRAQLALRAAFVSMLVRRMKRTGILSALLKTSFITCDDIFFPTHPCAFGTVALLKPLCRSGVAAGGAGGGGPGYSGCKSMTVYVAAGTSKIAA